MNILNNKQIEGLILKFYPKAIFYLAGQSSVSESYKKSSDTYKSNYIGALNFLKILKRNKLKTKFVKANSAYIFNGNKKKITINSKLIKPESPYTDSQIKAFKAVKRFRSYGVNCYSAIFFNIESNLRSKKFITQKMFLILPLKMCYRL